MLNNKPTQQEKRDSYHAMLPKAAIVFGVLLSLSFSFSACGGKPTSSGPPGFAPNPALLNQAAINNQKTKGEAVALVMATEILDAGTNPFLNKLPKVDIPVTAPVDTGPDIVELDIPTPQNLTLLGVLAGANGKQSTALLSLGEGSASEMVKRGDVIFVSGQRVEVSEVRKDAVDLMYPDNDLRTLFLPDIIGYSGSRDTSVASADGEGSEGASAPPQATSGKSLGDILSGLKDNTKKVIETLADP